MAVLRRVLFHALAVAGVFATSGCCCCCSPDGGCGTRCGGRYGLMDCLSGGRCCSPGGECGSSCGRCGLLDDLGFTCGGCGCQGCGASCGGGCSSCGSRCSSSGGCGSLGDHCCGEPFGGSVWSWLTGCGRYPDESCGAGSYHCGCGCGELYLGDWHSFPPRCCDPCDCYGNYTGCHGEGGPWYQLPPRVGSAGPAPPPPMDMPRSRTAPSMPTSPMQETPMPGPTSRVKPRRASPTKQASYDEAPRHCPTCGD
jgi:hypothetical protein